MRGKRNMGREKRQLYRFTFLDLHEPQYYTTLNAIFCGTGERNRGYALLMKANERN